MSLITLALWVAGIISLLGVGIAFLPNGADYPLPPEIIEATTTLYSWLWSFNMIFPVDVLVQVLAYGVLVDLFCRLIWPMIMWLFRIVTGART